MTKVPNILTKLKLTDIKNVKKKKRLVRMVLVGNKIWIRDIDHMIEYRIGIGREILTEGTVEEIEIAIEIGIEMEDLETHTEMAKEIGIRREIGKWEAIASIGIRRGIGKGRKGEILKEMTGKEGTRTGEIFLSLSYNMSVASRPPVSMHSKGDQNYVWLPRKTRRKSLGLVLSWEQNKLFLLFRDGNIGGGLVMVR
jgi:hypothetical protein